MKLLKDLNLVNKRVLIRADLNVPLDENFSITDDNRIRQFIPTLQAVLKAPARAIVMSHLGSPKSRDDRSASLKPIAARLGELLGKPVQFAADCCGPEVEALVEKLQPGEVLLLENLRYQPGETKNDPELAKKIARLGDVYISDAFGTAHRAHCSMVGVAQLFKEKGAGLLMQREVEYYERSLLNPARPLCVILGGSKVSSKLALILNLIDKADRLVIGGAMANTFLAAKGHKMGSSLVEADLFDTVRDIESRLKSRNCILYLPIDFTVGSSPKTQGDAQVISGVDVPEGKMALDIGPRTSELYKKAVQDAATIVWNGPMGVFENPDYSNGTFNLVDTLSTVKGLTVVGGGDTDAAIHERHAAEKFSFVSTGGGAFLELLEGKALPGIVALG